MLCLLTRLTHVAVNQGQGLWTHSSKRWDRQKTNNSNKFHCSGEINIHFRKETLFKKNSAFVPEEKHRKSLVSHWLAASSADQSSGLESPILNSGTMLWGVFFFGNIQNIKFCSYWHFLFLKKISKNVISKIRGGRGRSQGVFLLLAAAKAAGMLTEHWQELNWLTTMVKLTLVNAADPTQVLHSDGWTVVWTDISEGHTSLFPQNPSDPRRWRHFSLFEITKSQNKPIEALTNDEKCSGGGGRTPRTRMDPERCYARESSTPLSQTSPSSRTSNFRSSPAGRRHRWTPQESCDPSQRSPPLCSNAKLR